MFQVKDRTTWTFYGSCPSGIGDETKAMETRPRKRLLKVSETTTTHPNYPCKSLSFCGNSTVGRRRARRHLLTLALVFIFYQFRKH